MWGIDVSPHPLIEICFKMLGIFLSDNFHLLFIPNVYRLLGVLCAFPRQEKHN